MARKLKAQIEVTAKTDQADKRLKGTKKNIEELGKGSKGLSGRLSSLSSSFTLVAGAALAAGAAFAKAIQLANQQEDAVQRLNSAIGNLNGENAALSASLQAQADALAAVTTAGDEDILRVQATIGLFVKEEATIKALTVAALDLAAAKGTDVVTAADQLTRTLVTENNALLEQGIVVEGVAGSTERLASLMESLAIFEGQAGSAAETTSGKISLLSDAFGDLIQSLTLNITKSQVFTDVLDGLTAILNKTAAGIDLIGAASKSAGSGIALVAESILPKFLAELIGVDGAALALVKSEEELRVVLKKQGEEAKRTADATAELTKAKEKETAAADAATVAEDAFTASLKALGVVLEDETNKALEKNVALLEEARRRHFALQITDEKLAEIELALAGSTDKVNAAFEGENITLVETIRLTDAYVDSTGRAVLEVDRLTLAEERNAVAVIASAEAKKSGSSFVTFGGGQFTVPEESEFGPNGRVVGIFGARGFGLIP